MGSRASFDTNQARLQFGEKRLDLSAPELAAENTLAFCADSESMKFFAISWPTVFLFRTNKHPPIRSSKTRTRAPTAV